MAYYNIILEGCDCVGKTSIFEEFIHNSDLVDIGMHVPAPKDYENGKATNLTLLKMANENHGLIFDRFMLGERVYAPMYRGYFPDYIDDYEKQLKDHNILFLIHAEPETVKERFDGKDIKKSDIGKILDLFRNAYERSKYPHKFMIDTTHRSPELCMRYMIKLLEQTEL